MCICRWTKSDYFNSLMGVQQGENLSPVLFSLFINDLEKYLEENNNSFLDFSNETCNNLLKLMVLMYADDTIIMSNSAEGLQKALDSLHTYCQQWGLQVNSTKTKITIFGDRKKTTTAARFTFNGGELEIVDSFKYLGILFNYNGKFALCKNALREQATKAMFALLNKCRKFNLPIDIQIELFDHTVLPVLTYGSEVWGPGCNKILEGVHLRFLKYILGVKNSTSSCMVYGETGRYPIDIHIKTQVLSYWLSIIQGKTGKLCYKMYSALYTLHMNNRYTSPWIMYVKNSLEETGINDIFITGTIHIPDLLENSIKKGATGPVYTVMAK